MAQRVGEGRETRERWHTIAGSLVTEASGSGGEALDGDGFPVIEGPPR